MKKQPNETPEQFEKSQSERLDLIRKKRYATRNPKKHPAWSRRHLNRNLEKPNSVYIPYLLLRTKKFTGHSGPQKQINHDLFKRAQFARRRGYYPEV